MKLIVGLGNPGTQYVKTRHNAGWMVLDRLVDDLSAGSPQEKHYSYLWGPILVGGEKLFLMKPLTYMNSSGEALRDFVRYHPVDPEDILIVYDEVALDVGRVRLRSKGSAGGHNGMKSIISCLETSEIPRLRIGVGQRPPSIALVDYVLGRFSSEDVKTLESTMEKAVDICKIWYSDSIQKAMNQVN